MKPLKPISNNTYTYSEINRNYQTDLFKPSKEHIYSKSAVTDLFGSHETLEVVSLVTDRLGTVLHVVVIILDTKPCDITIVAITNPLDDMNDVSVVEISDDDSAVQTPHQKLALSVATEYSHVCNRFMGISLTKSIKADISNRLRRVIPELAANDKLNITTVTDEYREYLNVNFDYIKAIHAGNKNILHVGGMDDLYNAIKDRLGDDVDISYTVINKGGAPQKTELVFSVKDSNKVFMISEHSPTHVSIKHYNSRGLIARSTKNPKRIELHVDKPSESWVLNEKTTITHDLNMTVDEFLVLLITHYPESVILKQLCRYIRY